MDTKRLFLIMVLCLIAWQLFLAWQKEHAPNKPNQQNLRQQTNATGPKNAPMVDNSGVSVNTAANKASTVAPAIPSAAKTQKTTPQTPAGVIKVKTDVYNLTIDKRGGNIVKLQLLQYPQSLNTNQSFELLNGQAISRYLTISGLNSKAGPDVNNQQAIMTSPHSQYSLGNQKQLQVNLYWQSAKGVKITKTYTFTRDSYAIKLNYHIDNQSAHAWHGNLYTAIQRTKASNTHESSAIKRLTYTGAAYSTPDKHYEKLSFSKLADANLNQQVQGGWVAMLQHYFVTAWVPNAKQTNRFYSYVNKGLYTIAMAGVEHTVAPKQQVNLSTTLYAGPEIASRLSQVSPTLDLSIDYGIFWPIAILIFSLMKHIYSFVGNWGWAIVLVTVVIKLALYWFSAMGYRSMAKMRRIQPKMTALKEMHGDDKQSFSKALMELYRKEKVSPLGGCLPILIQIPIFLALYWVLVESVELRHAPFILWIHDLSTKDPYFVLPILMGVTMFLQQKMSPAPPDPTQAKVMMFLPVVFTFLFMTFPAGLVLYWLTNNTLSIIQQWHITQRVEREFAEKFKHKK